jgi:hypothetical protein
MALVLLTDLSGQITDYNILAKTAFQKNKSQQSEIHNLSLAEIGLENFENPQFRRQNGFITRVLFGKKMGECTVQV